MHFHVSLPDMQGRNIFAETVEGQWTPAILHALGGLKATMAESMLVFAPHANSAGGGSPAQSYAPVSPSWGVNNRSVALRIPAGDVRARRIEHRPAGVDANPYLVAATVLAGIRTGWPSGSIRGPRRPATAMPRRAMPRSRADWRSAIVAAQGSAFLKDALGVDMHRTFCAIKAAEYARVARTVSEVDFDLYLHTV
jgi:glutamine synthetase